MTCGVGGSLNKMDGVWCTAKKGVGLFGSESMLLRDR